MNIYALISLLAAIVCILVANFIYFYNPKNRLNQLIAIMGIIIGFLAFVEFMYRQAESIQTASFWISISSLWYFVPAILLNIGLMFNQKFKSFSNKKRYLIYFFIYFPSFIFTYLGMFTNYLTGTPILEFYGWTYSIGINPIFFGIMSIYTILWTLMAAFMLFSYYSKTEDFMEKKQVKYIFIGLYFPFLVSLISDIIFPIFWQRIPEMTMTSISLGLVFMAYGTWRYQFPLLTPSLPPDKIINTMSNLLIILDYRNNIMKINPATLKILGYEESEVYGKPLNYILINSEENKLKLDHDYHELKTLEINLKNANNQIIPSMLSFSSIKIRDDQPNGTILIGSDLTEEIKMREALYESEELYKTLVKTNPDSVVKTDLEGNITYLSSQTVLMHGYDNKDELYGKSYLELFTPESQDTALKNIVKTLKEGSIKNIEYNLIRKDGTTFIGELNTAVIKGLKKNPTAIIFTGRDITHHKETEMKIQKSLDEKEIMLREIHHRVKNNLQVISSLLNLQSRYIKDPDSVEVFKESQNRVKSMAMIHEKLYQSPDLAYIDFSEYINSLIKSLFSSYLVNPDSIRALIEINDIYLDVNTAIPLGLIVNEIISNSIKHAFPQQQSGEIKIKMFIENGSNILEISDNGIGIPDDFNIENTSTLGMQLINSLKSQINSQLEVFNQGGTYFKIVFDSSTTKEDFYGFKNKNG